LIDKIFTLITYRIFRKFTEFWYRAYFQANRSINIRGIFIKYKYVLTRI